MLHLTLDIAAWKDKTGTVPPSLCGEDGGGRTVHLGHVECLSCRHMLIRLAALVREPDVIARLRAV